ncbi:MAG: PfkB family carbohydrate kinase, partial [bacterium]|nr:PfkB family carbohydrate kinase [bacterium]
MESFDIVTITVNPALDKSAHFKGLVAEQKIRCEEPRYDAGGGGINVSKAISRLGGTSLAVFTSGGPTGKMLEGLISKERIKHKAIEIQSWTRESFVGVDDNTNSQYRFSFPGPAITSAEKEEIIKTIRELKPKFLVVSGGLNKDLSIDFYQKIAEIAKKSDSKMIVDTSG